MRSLTVVALAFTAALMIVGPAKAQAAELDARLSDPATHWTNQGGSTMTLVFDCNGSQVGVCTLSGNYVNNESGFNCKGTPYPLTGVYYINTQTISWSVAWSNAHEDCASVTGWTGYLTLSSTSQLQFVTNWNLAYSTGGSGRAIMQGQDTFTQKTTVSSGTLLKTPRNK
jgi:hypothetical protein